MTDSIITELLAKVAEKKAKISAMEGLKDRGWATNCSYSVSNSPSDKKNIQVLSVDDAVLLLAHVVASSSNISKARQILGIPDDNDPVIQGYKTSDWVRDVKKRVAVATYFEESKRLADIESQLNALVSPEVRKQLELERISRELNK